MVRTNFYLVHARSMPTARNVSSKKVRSNKKAHSIRSGLCSIKYPAHLIKDKTYYFFCQNHFLIGNIDLQFFFFCVYFHYDPDYCLDIILRGFERYDQN